MNAQIVESNLAKVEWKVSESSQKPSQGLPAIWIVVDEEDWSGANDCGAIHMSDQNLAEGSIAIEQIPVQPPQGDWPIESCS